MKIIQSFKTFGGARMTGGQETPRAFLAKLEDTYKIHRDYDYMMFTDSEGYKLIGNTVPCTVIDMPILAYDRIVYDGKFQAQSLMTESYIHVDLDAVLLSLPEYSDVWCEKLRDYQHTKEVNDLCITANGITQIPCSGLIGFGDMNFQRLYLNKVFELIRNYKDLKVLNYKHCWAIEELSLAVLIKEHNKSIATLNCKHDYFR